MKTSSPTLLHVLKYPPGQGGMDNIQALHAGERSSDEAFIALLARPGQKKEGRGGPWTSWRAIRHRFKREVARVRPAVTIYYNCWGADRLADLDPAAWRIGYLHSDFPGFEAYVRHFGQSLNGFLCVSEGLAAKVRRCLPDLPASSVWCAPIPIGSVTSVAATVSKVERRDLVIGYAGRLVREQKRVDRLPEFLRQLEACGLRDWTLEIVGDGPERAALEGALAGDVRVTFLGWQEAAATRAAMQRWRYQITLSDYEGLSLALLEAAAAGCLPVYPQFNDGAAGGESDLPAELAAACFYPKGDLAAAAGRIAAFERLLRERPDEAQRVRAVLMEFGGSRTEENYLRFWTAWRAQLAAVAPGKPKRAMQSPGWLKTLAPVWSYNRGYRARVQSGGSR